MKLIFLGLVLLMISITTVLAVGDWPPTPAVNTALDREVITIPDCYNLSLRVKQTEGLKVTPTFKDCIDDGDGYWHCDCRDSEDDYILVMRTDGADIEDDRYYSISMTYYEYSDIRKAKDTFTVRDWGTDISTSGSNIEDLGRDTIVVEKIVYVNQTVYQDKIVEKPVYVDKIVNVPTEDLTRINLLQEDNKMLQEKLIAAEQAGKKGWLITFLVLSILLNIILVIIWRKNR